MPVKATARESNGCALPFRQKMNADEILWDGFMKSAMQTTLWLNRGKVLLPLMLLLPLAESGQEN